MMLDHVLKIPLRPISAALNRWRICLGFYVVAVFVSILPMTDWLRSIPGDLGDARFNSFILEHVYQWLTGKTPYLWSPPFFYPFEETLGFSDNHFGSIATYFLARILGFEREYAYLAWIVVGLSLNYFAMYYVLRRLGFSGFASAFGALIFAFSLPTAFKTAHAQLVHRFAIPLAFLFFWGALKRGRIADFCWMVFWVVWQFFCSIYLGLFLVYLLIATLIGWLIFASKGERLSFLRIFRIGEVFRSRRNVIALALAFVMSSSLLLMLIKYLTVSKFYEFETEPLFYQSMLPQLKSYLYAPLSLLYGSFVDGESLPMSHEHMMFMGLFASALLIFGAGVAMFFRHGDSLGKTSVFSLIFLVLMTISVNGQSFYHIVAQLPGVYAIRAVSRIVLIMLFPVSIIIAVGVDYLRERLACKRSDSGVALILLFILAGVATEIGLFNHYKTPISAWRSRIFEIEALLPKHKTSGSVFFLQLGHLKDSHLLEIDAMIAAQDRGERTVNGYSGHTPHRGWGLDKALYACKSFDSRLNSFLSYSEKSGKSVDVEAISSKINLVVPPTCKGIDAEKGVLDTVRHELVDNLDMYVQLKVGHGAVVGVLNRSSYELPKKMHSSGGLKFSWRIIPDDGNTHNEIGWDARAEVPFDLQPKESFIVPVSPKLPEQPGFYRIQVSMVYEGLIWLHDAGLKVGEARFVVD